ncbi:transporter [Xanthobacter sp. TB0136]|uniref:transporter n=1 Tax=Xanthobacter sp. TB0136 TaxID=3459177 RepID=UPI004039A486
MKHSLAATLCGATLALVSTSAFAIDVAPGDYTILPPDSKVGLVYYQYSTASNLNLDGVGKVPNSRLDASVAILRGLYYSEVAGFPVMVQTVMPMGYFHTARIGDVNQGRATGVGDVMFAATFWPISPSNPETGTTLGLSLFVTAPMGHYHPEMVSIGGGAGAVTPQVGLIQGLGSGFYLDATADVALSFDHDERGATYSREAAYQVQVALRKQFTQTTSISLAYSSQFGGVQKVNGVENGMKTDRDQVRLYANTFITPTTQIQGMFGTDVHVEGGFKSGAVLELRLMQLF